MQPDLIKDITSPYLSNGLIGATCLLLMYVCGKLWNKLESERQAHKIELAAKDAVIKEIYDERVAEAKLGYTFATDYKNQNDALLQALRGKGQA